MLNIAILALSDFENWNNQESLSMGGASGVIKSILPYIKADNIYLMGITSDKKNLYKEIPFNENISIVPIVFVSRGSKIPVRFHAFYYSIHVNSILKKFKIHSVYSHSVEMSFWIKPGPSIILHMHGSTNALKKSKNKLFRNKLFQNLWESIRAVNIIKATKIIAIDSLCLNLAKKQNKEGKTILMPNFVDTKVFYKDDTPSKILEPINENILWILNNSEKSTIIAKNGFEKANEVLNYNTGVKKIIDSLN